MAAPKGPEDGLHITLEDGPSPGRALACAARTAPTWTRGGIRCPAFGRERSAERAGGSDAARAAAAATLRTADLGKVASQRV